MVTTCHTEHIKCGRVDPITRVREERWLLRAPAHEALVWRLRLKRAPPNHPSPSARCQLPTADPSLLRDMPFQCIYCAGLTISTLVNLVKTEPPKERFSQQAFYQHHGSIADLQRSAEQGCAFCTFIVQCLKGYTDSHHIWATTWIGSSCKPGESLFEAAAQSPESDIKIRLLPRGKTHLDSMRRFSVLDTLYVQIRPSIGLGTESDDDDDDSFMCPDSIPDDLPVELSVLLLKVNGSSGNSSRFPFDRECLSKLMETAGGCLFIDGYRIGADQVDPDLGSTANFRLA